jgi:1,4-alpha-glucan branching enzyme
MIARSLSARPGTALVSFVIEPRPEHRTGAISVVGDFNDWDPTRHVFRGGADGRWRATVVLQTGRRHAFRYLAENGEWFDEPDADDRRDDGHGRTNCILDLTRTTAIGDWVGGASMAAAP